MKRDSDLTSPLLVDELTLLVSRACMEVMRLRETALAPRTKADASPVTAADEASEEILLEGIARLLPGIAIVAEEAAARSKPARPGRTFVLIDPLDGTREIIAGRDEFTVNVAIVEDGRPVTGLLAAPALSTLWRGTKTRGAERMTIGENLGTAGLHCETIRSRTFDPGRAVAVVSRSHLDAASERFLSRWPKLERRPCGSSLKFARLAEGAADLYPRLAPVSEWDVAAGDAILTAAGGIVLTPEGSPLLYGRQPDGFRIPGFVAWSDPAAAENTAG